MITCSLILFNSCKEDSVTPKYNLSGVVTNTTDRGVNFAIVELYKSGESNAQYSSSTNSSGQYQLDNIEEGTYELRVKAQGYNETFNSVSLNGNTSKDIQILGNANISGLIVNSQTGDGLANATISFTVDQSAATGDNAELQVTTDISGYYAINSAPTGEFTCIIEAEGFFTRKIANITITDGTNDFESETIVEQPETGAFRIILTWGQIPDDLDSHLTGPSADGRFHIYYNNEYYGNDAELDVDDISSYGPETITIKNFTDGMYRYSVHNFSDQSITGGSGIAQSPTTVEVYDHTGLIKSYTAPSFTGEGNTWRVFEMDVTGTNANIRSINAYVQASDPDDIDIMKNSGNKKPLTFYMDEL